MASSADVTAIIGYAGQYEKALIRRAANGLDVVHPSMFFKTGVKTKTTLTKIIVNGQVKPYTGDWAYDAGDLQYVPRTLEVGKWQRDLLWDPEDFRDSYFQDLKGAGENANNKTIPFAQYAWESVIGDNMAQLNDATAYHGVGKSAFGTYDNSSAYDAGDLVKFSNGTQLHYYECIADTSAGESPLTASAKWTIADNKAITKGFGAQIAEDIANIKVVNTGSLDNENTYDACVAIFRALPNSIKTKGGVLYMAPDMYENLVDNIESAVSKNFQFIDGIGYLPKTDKKCAIVNASWMAGSNRIIASAAQNLGVLCDLADDDTKISAIQDVYKIKTGMSAVIGFGIRDLEAMVVNDQA